MATIIVRKRYGSEWLDVREFVRPRDYMTGRVLAGLTARGKADTWDLWAWVIAHVNYPAGPEGWQDGHTELRFRWGFPLWPIPRFGQAQNDFWSYPSETLRDRMGDCKDSAILLTTMLRAQGVDAWVTVGTFDGVGHVWTALPLAGRRWQVLDTTLAKPTPRSVVVYESGPYRAGFRFNEQRAAVVDAGDIPGSTVTDGGKSARLASAYRILPS